MQATGAAERKVYVVSQLRGLPAVGDTLQKRDDSRHRIQRGNIGHDRIVFEDNLTEAVTAFIGRLRPARHDGQRFVRQRKVDFFLGGHLATNLICETRSGLKYTTGNYGRSLQDGLQIWLLNFPKRLKVAYDIKGYQRLFIDYLTRFYK